MIRSVRLRGLLLVVSGLALASGCASSDQKDTIAMARGWEVEVKSIVELKKAPAEDDATTLLTTIDAEVTKLLETRTKELLAGAIKRYDETRKPEQTQIDPKLVEVILENYAVAAIDKSAVRKDVEDRKPRFQFTLRRAKARIVPEPVRIEVTLTCIENSRAPGDTVTFSQDFRAEVLDSVNKVVFDVANAKNLEPVQPRPAQSSTRAGG